MNKKKFLCTITLFFFYISLFATEKIKTESLRIVSFPAGDFQIKTLNFHCNEALAIKTEGENRFLRGFEIEIKYNTAAKYVNDIIYEIYTDLKPPLSEKETNYHATRLFSDSLREGVSTVFYIPLIEEKNKKNDPSVKQVPFFPSEQQVFLLKCTAKTPLKNIEKINVSIKIKPMYKNEGGLKLQFEYPDKIEKPLSVQINDEYLYNFKELTILPPGEYKLVVSSNDYRSEILTCTVEKAKIAEVCIALKSIIPLVTIHASEEVQVFIDKTEVTDFTTPHKITTGKHTVTFKAAGYTIMREIVAEEGKTYTISVLLDAVIIEE
ncbi:hypothetical protein DWQ65_07145 [Treponema phagedenis]|uniref:Uncharacterized protein n=1 Tax=Treponema phagedenis TaxID=162 RepID=A0A0B7H035_TREPH|nr:DUF4397 domain-containing protein [Treponema phagedenis]EFW38915.1 hypothetical protein HMPREF9554_00574 [Treponema phagedenis F0421]NVP25400.1 DUF4397 domain-containing protein [Treponema phagedenis]QEK00793.1 DUF4397 domain-containing protein [Treponema phagedenis]QKS92174.1 DUF4397 domain-containing protein [Treponema phagedenis]QLC57525.1 DUF4397 domain-containing protein [Treponema phagedenis]